MKHKTLFLSTVLLLYTGLLTWFWVSYYHPLFLESYRVRLTSVLTRLHQSYEINLHQHQFVVKNLSQNLSLLPIEDVALQRRLNTMLNYFAGQLEVDELFIVDSNNTLLAGTTNLDPALIKFIVDYPKAPSKRVHFEQLRLYEMIPNYLFWISQPLQDNQGLNSIHLYMVRKFEDVNAFFPRQSEEEFDFALLEDLEILSVAKNTLPTLGSNISFDSIESISFQASGVVNWRAQFFDLNQDPIGSFIFTSYWKPAHTYFFKSLALYLLILLLGVGIVLWVVWVSSRTGKEAFKFSNMITNEDVNININIPLDKADQSMFRQIQKVIDARTRELEEAKKELQITNEILVETLERFNPGISDLIFKGNQKLGIVDASVMIMDTVGYTVKNMVFGEVMVSKLMNQVFRFSHISIARYGGYKDKMVGDQIISIYGIDKDDRKASKDHAIDSILSGMEILRNVEETNPYMQQLAEEDRDNINERYDALDKDLKSSIDLDNVSFDVRLGINSSISQSDVEIDRLRMVMMGGETGLDYTGQGGAFICAARLESNARAGSIHIGINTKNAVDHLVVTTEIEPIVLKGLGQQRRFEVTDWHHVLDSFPESKAADLYKEEFPPDVLKAFYDMNVGEIFIKEIAKLYGSEVVPVHYYEHTTGHRGFALSRSFFAYTVAKNMGLGEQEVKKAIYFTAWRSMEDTFRNYGGTELRKKYLLEDQIPFKAGASETAFLLRDIRVDKPTTTLGQICKLAILYDTLQFDHSYDKRHEGKLLSHNQTLKRMVLEFPEFRKTIDNFDDLFRSRA